MQKQDPKADFLKTMMVSFLGVSDRFASTVEKGLTDLMTAAQTNWEDDVEDVVTSMEDDDPIHSEGIEVENVNALKIVSASMDEAIVNLGEQAAELDELGYVISSISTVWEVADPNSYYYDVTSPNDSWVVVSYLTYD